MTCINGAATSFLDPASNHCYFVVPGGASTSVDDSAQACAAAAAHLVQIVSDREMGVVASGSPYDGYWIGLRKAVLSASYTPVDTTTIEPGWTSTCSGCYGRIDADAGGFECLTASKVADADWSHMGCTQKPGSGKVTLCEQEPPGHRTAPCMGDKVCFSVPSTLAGVVGGKTKRYVFVPSVITYADAVQTCGKLGASLLVYDSREEREEVAAAVASMATDFWLDLDRDKDAGWTWDSGLDASEVWGTNEPITRNGTHAYVVIGPGKLDSELAHVAGDSEQHYVICQQ
jgi:hypothetical protein